MMRSKSLNYLIILLIFSSCSALKEYRLLDLDFVQKDSGSSWNYYNGRNEFDGPYILSSVTDENGVGAIRILSWLQSKNSYMRIRNGDSYICSYGSSYYSSIPIEFIFKNDMNEVTYEASGNGFVSRDNEEIYFNSVAEMNLVLALNLYDEVLIRTKDSCGNIITLTFNIRGISHLDVVDKQLRSKGNPYERQDKNPFNRVHSKDEVIP